MDRNRGPYIRLVCAAAALAVGIGAAWFSHHRLEAKTQALHELHGEVSKLHETVNRGRAHAAAAAPVAERTVLKDQAGLGDLLEDLSGQLAGLQLGDRSIQTMPAINTKHWQRFPMALSCKGEFTPALQFVHRLEESELLIRVDRLAFNRDPRDPQSPLSLQLSLSAYARREATR